MGKGELRSNYTASIKADWASREFVPLQRAPQIPRSAPASYYIKYRSLEIFRVSEIKYPPDNYHCMYQQSNCLFMIEESLKDPVKFSLIARKGRIRPLTHGPARKTHPHQDTRNPAKQESYG